MKICPSIASCDVMRIEQTAKRLEKEYGHIHIDIEDGNFINNITFGMKVVKGIAEIVKCELSIHLMVTDPLQYLEEIAEVNPFILFIHPDCTKYPKYIINSYRKAGIRVGIALNPAIELKSYRYLLEENIEDILIMMCEPDRRGQEYIPYMERKVKECLEEGFNVWVDGAISKEKAKELSDRGVQNFIMGRAIREKD